MANNYTTDPGVGGKTYRSDEIGGIDWPFVKLSWGPSGTANIIDAAPGKALPVQGEAAEDAAVTGNPVQVGGRYDATPRTLDDGDVGGLALDAAGQMLVASHAVTNAGTFVVQVDDVGSVVDAGNSTTSTLTSASVFTGTGVDLLGYSTVCVTLFASHDSAADGMQFQFSTDDSNWDDSYDFTMDVSDEDARRFQFPITARYFRVKYTNGGTNQTAFRVQTILHTANQLTSIHRLSDAMVPDRSAQVVKGVLYAQAAGSGNFVSVQSTAGGNLKVSIEEFDTGAVVNLPDELSGPASPTIDSYDSVAISVGASATDSVLVAAPGADKQIWVYGFVGSADTAAGTISLQDSDNAAGSGVMAVSETGGFSVPPSGNFAMPWLKIATNKALEMDTVACGFKGVLSYAIVSV